MAANGTAPTLATDPDITFEDYAGRVNEEVVKFAADVATLFGQTFRPVTSIGGSANAITGSASPTVTAYANGQGFTFLAAATNTDDVTFNIDGEGAEALLDEAGAQLPPGTIIADNLYVVRRQSGAFRLIGTAYFLRPTTDGIFRVSDVAGNSGFVVWENGQPSLAPKAVLWPGVRMLRSADDGWADDYGNVGAAVNRFGHFESAVANHAQVGGVNMRTLLAAQVPAPNWNAQILGFHASGQSLAGGSKGDPLETEGPAEYGSLMFAAGVRASDAPVPDDPDPDERRTSWVGLEETISGDAENKGETIATGLCTTFRAMISAENRMQPHDQSVRCFASTSYVGATKIADLDKGSANYDNLMADVEGAYDLATAAGLSYKVPVFPWLQGEKDADDGTDPATYKGLVEQLQADFEDDVNAITGRSDVIPMLKYQVASHVHYGVADPAIARAEQELFESSSLIICVCPAYIFDYVDGHHLYGGREYRRLGAYFGWMAKRIEIDGAALSSLKPLVPTSHLRTSATIELTFRTRHGGLRIDLETVVDNTEGSGELVHGFELFDDDGTTPIPIGSVSVWPPCSNKLLITVAPGETVPANAVLQYAHRSNDPDGESGRSNGPRGNIRDEQGESQIFNGYAIHNFAPIFRRVLT